MVKILDGFVQYKPGEDLDYPEYRKRLFEFAETYRPIVRQVDLIHNHVSRDVLAKFGVETGLKLINIYGDLPDQQILDEIDIKLTPENLIKRYNLGLAQGILYRCYKMDIKIWDEYKVVFQYLKLAQLMHKTYGANGAYLIEIDGPFSLFRRTQKYGVNLARFLPGLLLAQKWQMDGFVNTEKGQRRFFLDHGCGLTSHYKKSHPFDSSVERAFSDTFKKRKTEWRIEREAEILDLGDSVLIPDFKFVHPDGREILLEIIGFWTPEYLEKKLAKLQRVNRKDLIIAVNENLNCSKDDFCGPVIFYKTRVKVKAILEVLNRDD